MKRLTVVVTLLALLGFMTQAGFVLAQSPEAAAKMASAAKEAYKKLLAEVDKNHDGKISKAEHQPIYKDKDKAEENFKMWDLNQDGFIAEEEYVKAVTNMRRSRK